MRIQLFLLLLLVQGIACAQAPDFSWAKGGLGASNYDRGKDVCIDSKGNIFVTGIFFSDTIVFDTDTLFLDDWDDAFIVKYSPNGQVLWAKSFGGIQSQEAHSICVDADDNILFTGAYTFAPFYIGNDTLEWYSSTETFVVKLDNNGGFLWARNLTGPEHTIAWDIATGPNGNVYVAGGFQGDSLFVGDTAVANKNNSGTTEDIFTAAFDKRGDFLWVKTCGGLNIDVARAVNTDPDGNVYTAGGYLSSPFYVESATYGLGGWNAGFIVKYDSLGQLLWSKTIDGVSSEEIKDITTDRLGNSYVTGYFYEDLTLATGVTLSNVDGHADMFLASYNPAGGLRWGRSAYGDNNQLVGYALATDHNNNVYVHGDFDASQITVGSTVLTNAGYSDVFLAKYSGAGTPQWAMQAGSMWNDFSEGIATDTAGQMVITGYFETGVAYFGSQSITGTGIADVYTAGTGQLAAVYESNPMPDGILVYPNPSNGFFNVTALKNIEDIAVLNAMGQTVYTASPNVMSIQLDLRTQPRGVYLLRISTTNGMVTGKVVLK